MGKLDVFSPGLGDDLRLEGAAEDTNLAPRVPVGKDGNLIAVDDVMFERIALEEGGDA
jgi:hypothetical protein